MLVSILLLAAVGRTPQALTGHAGAVVGDKVFVCGGMGLRNEGRFYQEAWMVDPASSTWSPVPEPKEARGMAAAAELDGAVYLAGGFNWGGQTLGTVEKLDLKAMRWSVVAPLKRPRSRFLLAAVGGKLYAVSGMKGEPHGSEPLNTDLVEEYDPAKNVWREAGRLNHARHGFSGAVWRGRIYVFGGNDEESRQSAEAWDPVTGKSEDLPPMPVPRGFGGIAVRNDRMILFGGRSIGRHPSCFDPLSRKWSELGIPDLDLNRFVSARMGNRLWIVGGESRQEIPVLQAFDLSTWE